MIPRRYLGDGVYVEHDGYSVVLVTHDGVEDTNTVILDDYTLVSLVQWLKEHFPQLSRSQT